MPFRSDDDVQFTVYRPRAVLPDHWYTMIAFAHLAAKRKDAPAHAPEPVEEVRRQAERVLGERQTRDYRVLTQGSPQSVPREETLTFVPDVPGVEFNPPHRGFRWTETVHREEFRLRAGSDLAGQTARGRLSVFLGDVLLADVPLALAVDRGAGPPDADAPSEAEHARPYRKIFASYSHKDSHVVEQIEHLARALGDAYLRDWKHLRAGEAWDERLLQMIDEADVFQLFWSRHAMESLYVRREYEHALSLNRPNFVRPTFWEEPLPSDPARDLPPGTLLRLHFQRIGPFLQSASARMPSQPAVQAQDDEAGDANFATIPGYKIIKPLMCGSLGSLYIASEKSLGDRLVVIKRDPLRDGGSSDFGPESRFRNMRHPGIVPILAVVEVGDRRHTIMPYMEGGSLDQRLREGPLPVPEAAELAMSLADALGYAHAHGVLHLNLKPSKVLFSGQGRPAVTGFRSVRLREEAVFGTEVFMPRGSTAYMALEQAAGDFARLGPRTDVYGIGAILYECLTGRPPFRGATPADTLERVKLESPVPPRRLRPSVPDDLELICLRCLAKNPAERYAACDELARDLVRFVDGGSIRASAFPPACDSLRADFGLRCAGVVLALAFILAAIVWISIRYAEIKVR